MAKEKNYFDGHHWEDCFAITCGKKCPYAGPCFGAQAADERAIKEFIEHINEQQKDSGLINKIISYFQTPTEEDIKSKLTFLENIKLDHAKARHGARFDKEKGIFYLDKNAPRDYTDTGVGSFIFR